MQFECIYINGSKSEKITNKLKNSIELRKKNSKLIKKTKTNWEEYMYEN